MKSELKRFYQRAAGMLLMMLLTTATGWAWDGSGTAESPYQIKNASDLDQLAANVNSGTGDDGNFDADAASGYSSKYFVLTANIGYDPNILTIDNDNNGTMDSNYTPIGSYSSFKGHFDGKGYTVSGIRIYKSGNQQTDNYQGLFGFISDGAEVKNVVLADAHITGFFYTGGIAGESFGGTISNCHVLSNVTIHDVANANDHGGIVGYNLGLVEGCTSAASITSIFGNSFGGVVGGNNGGTVRDCLYFGNTVKGDTYVGAIVGYNNATVQNCYFTSTTITGKNFSATLDNANSAVGRTGGTVAKCGLPRTVEAGLGASIDAVAFTGTVRSYTIEGVTSDYVMTAYSGGGIEYRGNRYYGNESVLSLTLSTTVAPGTPGYNFYSDYAASAGTLSGAGSSYTLTMADADATISAAELIDWATESSGDSWDNAYMIYNKHQLDLLAHRVNGTHGETATNYEGKYFKLGADISYTHDTDWNNAASTEDNYEAIGGYYNGGSRYFKGHFDGKGKTVSGIRIYKSGDTDADKYQGLFGSIVGAEVKNVVLADARITGYYSIGGIAGKHDGGTISNCHVLSNVVVHNVFNGGSYHGGIVGYNLGLVEGCTSAASITTATGCNLGICGGIVGYNCYKQNGNTRIVDCLYLGSNVAGGSRVGAIAGLNTGIIENSYYSSGSVSGKNENGDPLANANCAVGYFSTGDNYGPVENVGRAYSVIAGQGVNIETIVPTGSVKKNYTPEGIATDAITAYNLGLAYCGRAYTACGVGDYCATAGTVSLTLSNTAGEAPLGYRYNYYFSAGTISGNATDGYTLTMPAEDVTITTALRSTGNSVIVTFVNENGQTYNTYAIALDGTENSLSGNAYYVGTDINYSNSIEFNDVAFLILGDGCTMTVNTDFEAIRAYKSLYIYGQALGTGKLNANGGSYGIYDSGDLYIIGGNVTINGGNCGIYADNLKLGWTNASDHIYANSYNIVTPIITINYGHPLTDADGNHYDFYVSAEDINGKHLYPYIEKLDLAANAHDGNYWTTFYCGHTGYKINANENACAYTAEYDNTDPNAPQLTLHKLGKVIPKGNAVILVGDDNEISMTASDKTATVPTNNLLGYDVRTSVADIKTTLGDGTLYVMGKVGSDFGFYQYTAQYMPARKAYLLVPGGNAAPGLKMVFDDGETSGLSEMSSQRHTLTNSQRNAAWYTLSGTRLNAKPTQKGIYIVNGKKVVIK